MTTVDTPTLTERDDRTAARASIAFAIILIVGGAIGWFASTGLLVERIRALQNPETPLSCDLSPFVSCGALFDRWQASLLGFPNPVIGVAGFVVPIVVGLGMLASARFASWFWRLVVVGLCGAWVFVTWLFVQSAFVIGVLCPYCLVVWAATIPLWWTAIVRTMADGHLGRRAVATGRALTPFIVVLVLANYAVIIGAIVLRFPYLLVG